MVFNTKRLKEINVELVKKALKLKDFGTKNSIASATGLSVATCRNILDELLLTGEVLEIELGASTGGRPSRRFIFNPNYAYIAILYLRKEGHENHMFCSVVNMRGTKIDEQYFNFDNISLREIDQVLDQVLKKYHQVKVLSLGVPGVVHEGTVGLCDFDMLSNLPLREYLTEKFQCIVTIENDVNCAALGYYYTMKNTHPESMAYIYYPQEGNAGAGIIVHGKVVHGQSNFAGEISFMPLDVERNIQGAIQKKSQEFISMAAKTIMSINTVINPAQIVVSGQWFTPGLLKRIEEQVRDKTPEEHIPVILYETNIHDSYIDGLKFLGIQKLSCSFEIVGK